MSVIGKKTLKQLCTQCIRIQIFSTMTLHVAPGDGFFGTQQTVICLFYSMNFHMPLSVVCDCKVFAIYIPNITMNNMSHMYIFHVAFNVTFFTLLFVLQVFFLINLTAIIKMVMSEVLNMILLHPHVLCQTPFRRVCFVALITIKLKILHSQSKNRSIRKHDCISQFLSIFSILSRFSFL